MTPETGPSSSPAFQPNVEGVMPEPVNMEAEVTETPAEEIAVEVEEEVVADDAEVEVVTTEDAETVPVEEEATEEAAE